jgi:hypothetical protein
LYQKALKNALNNDLKEDNAELYADFKTVEKVVKNHQKSYTHKSGRIWGFPLQLLIKAITFFV